MKPEEFFIRAAKAGIRIYRDRQGKVQLKGADDRIKTFLDANRELLQSAYEGERRIYLTEKDKDDLYHLWHDEEDETPEQEEVSHVGNKTYERNPYYPDGYLSPEEKDRYFADKKVTAISKASTRADEEEDGYLWDKSKEINYVKHKDKFYYFEMDFHEGVCKCSCQARRYNTICKHEIAREREFKRRDKRNGC